MSDSAAQVWWIDGVSGPEGPFTSDQLMHRVRTGELRGESLVCQGQGNPWVRADMAFPTAFAPAPPPPGYTLPTTTPPPPGAAAPQYAYVPPAPNLATRVDVGLSTFLTLITLGIYWLFWMYPRLSWYSRTSGRPIGNRVTYFWVLVGLFAGGILTFLIFPILGFPIFIAGVVFGSLLTNELAKDQEATVKRLNPVSGLPATPTTLVVLYAVGNGIGITVILLPASIVILIFYYVFFFRNHNAMIHAAAVQ